MATNHQLLLNHLIKCSDTEALAHYLNVLSDLDNYGGVQLNAAQSLEMLKQLDMLCQKPVNKDKGMELFFSAQGHFHELLRLSGLTPTPRHKMVHMCIQMNLGLVLAGLAKNWQENELAQFKRILAKTSVSQLLLLERQWEKHPHMLELLETRDEMTERVLYGAYTNILDLKCVMRGKSWTSQQADEYIVRKVWPQWKNGVAEIKPADDRKELEDLEMISAKARLVAGNQLEVLVDKDIPKDKVPMVLKVSDQAWARTIFAEKFSLRSLRLLEVLEEEMAEKKLKLNINFPVVDRQWEIRFLDSMAENNDEPKPLNGVKGLLLKHFEASEAKTLETSAKIDWDIIGKISLANTSKPSNLYISADIVQGLAKRLNKDNRKPPKINSWMIQTAVDLHWLSAIDIEQLDQHLDNWAGRVNAILHEANATQRNSYHTQVAQVLLKKIDQAQSSGKSCPKLTRVFWHHFIAAGQQNCRGVAKLALLIADRPSGDQVWNIGDVPALGVLTREDIAREVKGKPRPEAMAAMKKTLLRLSLAVDGKLCQGVEQGSHRLKM